MANLTKPIVCLDFDGVIHDYREGWKDGSIYGNVVPGFFEWAARAQQDFELVIYSSRSGTEEGRRAMSDWLNAQLQDWRGDPITLHTTAEKPPAYITIDDRAICFKGDWSAPGLHPRELLGFRPWMMLS